MFFTKLFHSISITITHIFTDHINSYSSFQTYTTGERYETLTEAYNAYKKQVNDNAEFTEYKDTLPE